MRTRHISIDTIRDAATTVYEAAVHTPLVRLPTGTDEPEVYLKLETLQPIGSFKIRGAYNAVRRLAPGVLAGGVWTVSAGNAAQGVALAARHAGAACSVLVMDTAPDTKLRAIERLGATIVKASYDECWRAVEDHRSDRMPGHLVHPFDDDDFISGNGTIALEIADDLPDVDAVIAPLGGGGLLTGIAVGLRRCVRMRASTPPSRRRRHRCRCRSRRRASRVRHAGRVVRRRRRRAVRSRRCGALQAGATDVRWSWARRRGRCDEVWRPIACT